MPGARKTFENFITQDELDSRIKDFKTPAQIIELVKPLLERALQGYDELQEPHRLAVKAQLDKQAAHLLEIYGNGSGNVGYMERARAEDKAVQQQFEQKQNELSTQVAELARTNEKVRQELASSRAVEEQERSNLRQAFSNFTELASLHLKKSTEQASDFSSLLHEYREEQKKSSARDVKLDVIVEKFNEETIRADERTKQIKRVRDVSTWIFTVVTSSGALMVWHWWGWIMKSAFHH